MAEYIPTILKREIEVESVVSVHYLEHAKNYAFKGESHDFWELVYVDKGQLCEVADELSYELLQGQMIFHKPNEYHNLMANGTVAPNVVIVSFVSHSPAMTAFEKKVMYATQQQRKLLSRIIQEARQAFSCPLGDPLVLQLMCDENAPFGSHGREARQQE